ALGKPELATGQSLYKASAEAGGAKERSEPGREHLVNDEVEDVPQRVVDGHPGRWATFREDFLERKAGLHVDFRLSPCGSRDQPTHFCSVLERLGDDFELLNHDVLSFEDCDALGTDRTRREVQRLVFVLVAEFVEEPQRVRWR